MQQQSGFGLSPHVTASSHLPFLSWFSCSSHPGYRGLARPGAATMFWFKCSLKKQLDSMDGSQTGDEHGVLGFSAGQLRQARGRRAPAGVVYLFFTATTTHSATPTPTHARPVHALQRRHPTIITEVLRRRVLGRGLQRAHPSHLRCGFLRQGARHLCGAGTLFDATET